MENKTKRFSWKEAHNEIEQRFIESQRRLALTNMKLEIIRAIMDQDNPSYLEKMLYFCAAVCGMKVVGSHTDLHLEPEATSKEGGAA